MDNLAHSLVAGALGTAVAPKEAKKDFGKLFFASILVANSPDADILLGLWGGETYLFEHRGFTHSLLGLTVMIPINVAFLRWFLRMAWPGAVVFALVQVLIGHIWLDLLTSFGTMLCFPSFERYSYPLMFIIDPVLWVIGLVGIFVLRRNPLRRTALGILALICALWSVEFGMKQRAQSLYESQYPGHTLVQSYPLPLAPLLWSVLAYNSQGGYHQAVVRPWDGGVRDFTLPEGFGRPNTFCGGFSEEVQGHFTRYQRFAEHTVCRSRDLMCECVGLKYGLAAVDHSTFGAYHFYQDGTRGMPPRDGFTKSKEGIRELFR